MILVDTSVWIDHFQRSNPKLYDFLSNSQVCIHPFIIGELSCGNLSNRIEILKLLKALPRVLSAHEDEILQFIENHRLFGKGLGYIDVHLLASALLNNVSIWTRDKRLAKSANDLKIQY